jgi:hypothetical protein
MSINLSLWQWAQIRSQFTQPEKDVINAAYAGESICPQQTFLDEDMLGGTLANKLKDALATCKK